MMTWEVKDFVLSTYTEAVNVAGVYRIYNQDTDEQYIGMAADISQRWITHLKKLIARKHENNYLQRNYNSGWNFNLEVLEVCENDRNVLFDREWFHIMDSLLFSKRHLLNAALPREYIECYELLQDLDLSVHKKLKLFQQHGYLKMDGSKRMWMCKYYNIKQSKFRGTV